MNIMLRNYQYTPEKQLVVDAVAAFADTPSEFDIVGFTAISPDSFLWTLSTNQAVYYLYAEDFVSDYHAALHAAQAYAPVSAELSFIPAKQPLDFESSTPNQSTTVYQPPNNLGEFQKYASQSGYDFVFLLRSSETV